MLRSCSGCSVAITRSSTMAITPLLALLLGVFCVPATADLLSYDPAALEYEVDSLEHVMGKLRYMGLLYGLVG